MWSSVCYACVIDTTDINKESFLLHQESGKKTKDIQISRIL